MSTKTAEPWANSMWISKSDAAKYIHVTDAEMNRILRHGEIPASVARFSRGGSKVVYVHIKDLDEYMRQSPYSELCPNNSVVRRIDPASMRDDVEAIAKKAAYRAAKKQADKDIEAA